MLLATALLVVGSASMAPVLEFAPPLGFRDDQRWTWDFLLSDGTRLVMTDRAHATVRQTDDKGRVVIEWAVTPISESVDGQVVALPRGLPPLKLRETRDAYGRMLDRDEHPVDGTWAFRYSRLWALPFPDAKELMPDQTWTLTEPGPDRSIPPLAGNFRVVESATMPGGASGWRIRWSRSETEGEQPLVANGETWVSAQGWPWRVEAVVKDARVPGSEAVTDPDSGGATLTFTAAPWMTMPNEERDPLGP